MRTSASTMSMGMSMGMTATSTSMTMLMAITSMGMIIMTVVTSTTSVGMTTGASTGTSTIARPPPPPSALASPPLCTRGACPSTPRGKHGLGGIAGWRDAWMAPRPAGDPLDLASMSAWHLAFLSGSRDEFPRRDIDPLPHLTHTHTETPPPHNTSRLKDLVLKWMPVSHNKTLEQGQEPELGDSPIKTVLRSKGFMWVANSHTTAFYWSHAGQYFEIRDEGEWWSAVADDMWPEARPQRDVILADFDAEGEWGDRRQEIVFIGASMDEAAITAQLDSALLTEEGGWAGFGDAEACILYTGVACWAWDVACRPVGHRLRSRAMTIRIAHCHT